MRDLTPKHENELKDLIGAKNLEDNETSITFKCNDRNIILKLLTRGYIQLDMALLFLDLLKKYDAIIYGSILKKYKNVPVELAAIKIKDVSIDTCEELNKKFDQVMIYPNNTIVWMKPSSKE